MKFSKKLYIAAGALGGAAFLLFLAAVWTGSAQLFGTGFLVLVLAFILMIVATVRAEDEGREERHARFDGWRR